MLVVGPATILSASGIIPDSYVTISEARIGNIGAAVPGAKLVDAQGMLLAPGFIDLQCNGGFGHDFTAEPESIWTVAQRLPQYGVTAFLPTILTSNPETIDRALAVLGSRPVDFTGANPLGLHLEGPFLNQAKKGAHNPESMRLPDPEMAAHWSSASGVRLVTLAPELPRALELMRMLSDRGVAVGAGHSLATLDEAKAAMAAGLSYGTHLFNAMTPLNHRSPGLAAALLDDPRAIIGLIVDGIHVHPTLVRLIWRLTGPKRFNLVSDAMAGLGMPAGDYVLAGQKVVVGDRSATLADGTLAGSIISLDEALRNLISYTGCSLVEAVATVTSTPATVLDLEREIGSIKEDYAADMVLLTFDGYLAATFIAGKIVYLNPRYWI